jgi:hypothetical protein
MSSGTLARAMSLPPDYQKRSASEKLDLLWKNINADPYPEGALPTRVPGALGRLKLLSVDHNRGSFEHVSDELPEDRPKLVHTHGTVACVSFQITEPHPYTGLFRTGSPALLRFSDATGGGKFTPSLALKFFIEGRPSVNLLALPTAHREPDDLDIFTSVYANATHKAVSLDAKLVQHAFQKAAKAMGGTRLYAVYLPLHHIAEVHTDGSAPSAPQVPDRIEFRPTKEAISAWSSASDFRTSLARIPAGTRLFSLWAAPKIDAEASPIGELVQGSPWIASRYGDERLFFQHDVGPRAAPAH